MRVVQLRRGRVAKLVLLAVVSVLCLVLVYKQYHGQDWASDLLGRPESQRMVDNSLDSGSDNNNVRSHQSHPGDKPKFLGKGSKGNYEPEKYGGGSGAGDNGKPHQLRVEQKSEEETLKGVYGFNQLVSDEISLNRTVPDTREEECRFWDYPSELPTASVILVFHNEGWSTLLRTVHSVINRSPPQFLHEIVLVDDKSELEHLHDRLEQEIKKPYYSKVKLVRNPEREGLIRARNNG